MKPYLIGITGGSGSGKTTFIKHISSVFSPQEVCIVSLDDYYLPRSEQHLDDLGIENFDLPSSFDKKELIADIQRLMNGETVIRKEYIYNNKDIVPKEIVFKPAPVIIVEGIMALHFKKLRTLLDLKVYLHAKENLKVIRRIRRDQIERGYPIDDVLYRYEHHVMPSFEKYIQPYIESSDMIINNNKDFSKGLEVFLGFLKSKMI